MTTLDDGLVSHTTDALARPIAPALVAARRDVLAAIADLGTIHDAALGRPWGWKGDSEEEVRYGFYRIAEAFDLAAIDAAAAMRLEGIDRGRAADLIAPTTAARWDLHGLLIPLSDTTWDADPGGGEWTIRQTLGHIIASQRGYAVGTAWWQAQGRKPDAPDLGTAPEALWEALPSEEAEAEGSPAEVRERLDAVVDGSIERLAGLPADRLHAGARWAGFAIDVGFRIGRWSSHIREHAIQVEKTLAMLGHQPTEIDRLVRHVLAAWGRAESAVSGETHAVDALGIVEAAADEARETAADIAAIART